MTTHGRWIVLIVGFLGWLCAGVHMSITQLAGQSAAIDLLDRAGTIDAARYRQQTDREQFEQWKPLVARWFAWPI